MGTAQLVVTAVLVEGRSKSEVAHPRGLPGTRHPARPTPAVLCSPRLNTVELDVRGV